MKQSRSVVLLLIMVGALCVSSCTSPQGAPATPSAAQGSGPSVNPSVSPSGGPGSPVAGGRAQRRERIVQMLGDVRDKKKTKEEVLKSLRERLEKHEATDVDARLAKVDAVIEQATAMDAATFGQEKDDLAKQVMEQMRGAGHTNKE